MYRTREENARAILMLSPFGQAVPGGGMMVFTWSPADETTVPVGILVEFKV